MSKLTLGSYPHMLGFEQLERLLERSAKSGNEGYPPYNIEQTSDHSYRITLAVAGFAEEDLAITVEDRQLVMPRSVERLEDRILNGTITVDASPVTYACAANAFVDNDGQGNRAFDKKRSRGRIDGVVTLAMAVGAADNELKSDGPSVYETRGLMFV